MCLNKYVTYSSYTMVIATVDTTARGMCLALALFELLAVLLFWGLWLFYHTK